MKSKYNLYAVDIERYYETLRISGIKMINDSIFKLIFENTENKGIFFVFSPILGILKFWEEGSGLLFSETDSLHLLKLPSLFK